MCFLSIDMVIVTMNLNETVDVVDVGDKREEEVCVDSKEKSVESNKNTYFRADKLDLKRLDIQLEKHLSRVWSRNIENQSKTKEEWEIDLSKLGIRYVIAHGTYGTVYRATYDNQDVAGNLKSAYILYSTNPLKYVSWNDFLLYLTNIPVKLLDWGEDGIATASETASLRASFRQEVVVWHKLDHPNVTKVQTLVS